MLALWYLLCSVMGPVAAGVSPTPIVSQKPRPSSTFCHTILGLFSRHQGQENPHRHAACLMVRGGEREKGVKRRERSERQPFSISRPSGLLGWHARRVGSGRGKPGIVPRVRRVPGVVEYRRERSD